MDAESLHAETSQQFRDVVASSGMPTKLLVDHIGCSRTTMHNWLNGKEISNAYADKIAEVSEVLMMCESLGAFPLTEIRKNPVYEKFFGAIVKLRAGLAPTQPVD
jgi:hypothetical protein